MDRIIVIFKEISGEPEAEGYLKAFLLYIKAAVSPKLILQIIKAVRNKR